MAKSRSKFKKLLFAFVAFCIVLFVIEGFCSAVLFVYDAVFWSKPPSADRAHTQYDADLGWAAVPDLVAKDVFGPGLDVQTNARGFRNAEPIDKAIPEGKVRVICSGDSFTFGYGVANLDTWPAKLATHDDRLQVVNMGMSGYGIGQMYLWHQRDGMAIDHDIHLLAFISADFNRMRYDRFLGYGKPRLELDGDKLVTRNVPVPEKSFGAGWFSRNAELLHRIRAVQLMGKAARAVGLGGDETGDDDGALSNEQTMAVCSKLFESLRDDHAKRGSVPVLVFLPIKEDYSNDASLPLRQFVEAEAKRLNILHIDLIDALRALSYTDMESMFLRPTDINDPAGAKHYSKPGNAFIAKAVYERLKALPGIAEKLE